MYKEWWARALVVLLLAAAIAIPALGLRQRSQEIVLHAHMAETGGWTPQDLTVAASQPLHLHLTSDDVMHSFAIGQSDQLAVDVKPGEITDVTLVFDRPGKYTFYCTRWCSVNHWRMRGTIEVTGPQTAVEAVKPPLYSTLGLNLDTDHHAEVIPAQLPAAWRGALLNVAIPVAYQSREYYLSHSMAELWRALRAEPSFQKLSDQDVWDLVAWVWQSNATPQEIRSGKQLYTANCAACHGEDGKGDGVFSDQLIASSAGSGGGQMLGEKTMRPVDFTDPDRMLSVSPAHLQGKILRGGMGTGMPYWGPIFSDEQTWKLVAYLWTFQFNMEEKP